MKKILISLAVFFATSSVWACDYTITMNVGVGDTSICVDGIKFKQLKENYYRVTFADFVPGTKIGRKKVNFHFNGKVENVESDFQTLDQILRTYDVGNLYFSYETGFILVPNEQATRRMLDLVLTLVDQINTYVH